MFLGYAPWEKMAGDLKRFLFEEKQSLRRYQSNLDAIIEKYNRPFDDNKVNLDIDSYSVIEGEDILKKKGPSYFGLSELPYTKNKERRWQNESSYSDESDSATYHGITDGYTSGYGSKLTSSSGAIEDSVFVGPLNPADQYSVCVEDDPLLYTNSHQHRASETFSLAEQNADVEDTEELLALKETMLTFIASDTEEPSDAETIRSSSTCGSDEWADGFECLSDSDEEITSDRNTPLRSNERSTGSPYDRSSNTNDACDEVDGEIVQERQYIRSAHARTPEQRYQKSIPFSLCNGNYDSSKNRENFRSPSTTGNGFHLREDDSSPSNDCVDSGSPVKQRVSPYHNLLNSNGQVYVNNVHNFKLPNRNVNQRSSEKTCGRDCSDETSYLHFLKTRMLSNHEKPQHFNRQESPDHERVKNKELPKEQRSNNYPILSRKFNTLASSPKDEIHYSGNEDGRTGRSNATDTGRYRPQMTYQRRLLESGQDFKHDDHRDRTKNSSPEVVSGFHSNRSVTEQSGKENVVQIFNRMSAKQGPDRDSRQRNSIIDGASDDLSPRTGSSGNLFGRETGNQLYSSYKEEVPQDLQKDKHLRNEEVGRKREDRNDFLQSNYVYKSAPPKYSCDLKDLPNGLSGAGFEEDKMPALEKVYRWLSPVNDDASAQQQSQIKARRRLHLAAPIVSDTLDKKPCLHSKEKESDAYQQTARHQNKWVSKSATQKVHQPYARTKPESPSTVFSRMKLNTPSPTSRKSSRVRSSETPLKNKDLKSSEPKQALFFRKQENFESLGRKDAKASTDVQNATSSTFSDFVNQQNVSTRAQLPSENCYTHSCSSYAEPQHFCLPARSNSVDRLSVSSKLERSKASFSSSGIRDYCTPTRLSGKFDSRTNPNHTTSILQMIRSTSESNNTHHSRAAKPADWLETSDQSAPKAEESIISNGAAVEMPRSSKAFVLSGTPNDNHKANRKYIDQNERNVLLSRSVNSQTFVKYTDEYTFKLSDEELSENVRNSHGKQIPLYSNLKPSSRFVCDRQVSEDVVPSASGRTFGKGNIGRSFDDCHDRVVAKREKRFTSPSRITHVYKSPVKTYLERNVFSPGSKNALVTVSSKAKLQSVDKDADGISHLNTSEGNWSKMPTPVRSLVKNTQPVYTRDLSSKTMSSQKPCAESKLSRFVDLKKKVLVNDQASRHLNCNKFTQSTPRKPDVVFSLNDTLSTICNEHANNENNMYEDSDSSEDTVLTID